MQAKKQKPVKKTSEAFGSNHHMEVAIARSGGKAMILEAAHREWMPPKFGQGVWYALRVSTAVESLRTDVHEDVGGTIEERVHSRLISLGVDAALPMREIEVRKRKCRRLQKISSPALRGLVFVYLIKGNPLALVGLQWVSGVAGTVGSKAGPFVIADETMRDFIKCADSGLLNEREIRAAKARAAIERMDLKQGDRVAVCDSSLHINGFHAKVVECFDGMKIALEIILFGREQRFELLAHQIKKP